MSHGQEASNEARLTKVLTVRVFEQAVEQIRSLIASGKLMAAEKLPNEQKLSQLLNVSRSSVREALRVLEAEGLVEVRRGSGTYVTQNPASALRRSEMASWLEAREETLEQMLQVRESIEGLAAYLAATRISAAALQELDAILAKQAALTGHLADDQDEILEELSQSDASFHLTVSSACGNDIANEIIIHILPALNESNKAVLYLGRRAKQMETEHIAIVDALIKGDPTAAEKAMRNHIEQVKNAILAI